MGQLPPVLPGRPTCGRLYCAHNAGFITPGLLVSSAGFIVVANSVPLRSNQASLFRCLPDVLGLVRGGASERFGDGGGGRRRGAGGALRAIAGAGAAVFRVLPSQGAIAGGAGAEVASGSRVLPPVQTKRHSSSLCSLWPHGILEKKKPEDDEKDNFSQGEEFSLPDNFFNKEE